MGSEERLWTLTILHRHQHAKPTKSKSYDMDHHQERINGLRRPSHIMTDEQTPLKGNYPGDDLYFRRVVEQSDSDEFTNGDISDIVIHPKTYLPEAKQQGSDDRAAEEYFQQKRWKIGRWTLMVSFVALGLSLGALFGGPLWAWHKSRMVVATLIPHDFDSQGRSVTEDYDTRVAFSDFLPGLVGIYGKPLYAFFVNRGQGIAALGIESKEYPIMEFTSANTAYQSTPLVGFRTFIQGARRSTGAFLVEPFSPLTSNYPGAASFAGNSLPLGSPEPLLPKRIMYSGDNELQIQELDYQHQIETNVTYFVLPEEDFGAFVRRTTITNLHGQEQLKLSVLDGLARVQPAGGKLNMYLKNMGQTLQSFMGVHFPYEDSITMPFYRLTTQPADVAEVQIQDRGHYCLSLLENEPGKAGSAQLLPVVYDTSKVFGEDTSLLRPVELFSKSIAEIIKGPQYGKAKASSCFGAADSITLGPGETATISTFFGAADDILEVPVISRRILQEGFVLYKLTRTREVIRQITEIVATRTSHRGWDNHIQQMFLDNALQGGVPIILGDDDDDGMENADEDTRLKVFHVFSRTHGDLERDYDDFILSPTFFSQGPGNFGDIIQSRRDDIIFNPRIGSFNVREFVSFIQADGYQPLSVEAVVFTIRDIQVCEWIAEGAVGRADGHRAQREALTAILNGGPFRPGQLFGLMDEKDIELVISRQEFIDIVASSAESWPMAVYKQGFWADHWTYYMDLIKSYLAIYPDGEFKLMYETELPYFFSPASVQPRRKKYVLRLAMDGYNHHVQQLDATVEDPEKLLYMNTFRSVMTDWYDANACWQGQIGGHHFKSTVAGKLLLLATLKFATRDAYGMGIEYEAERPGWDNANNGLPAMIGSGMPETFELKILLRYLLTLTLQYNNSVHIPTELFDLINVINIYLEKLEAYRIPSALDDIVPKIFFEYWDGVSTAREAYREKTKIFFSGNTTKLVAAELAPILNRWLAHLDAGIARAAYLGTTGAFNSVDNSTTPTYFAFEVIKYEKSGEVNRNGDPFVVPLQLKVVRLPVFLEGPTRMLKTVTDKGIATEIYWNIREHSGLRDVDLSMYTVSADLHGQSVDIGRTMAFPPGWSENQGISLHMSYKFYLELLRQGLHDEFFAEATSGGVLPFMNSEVYGRSLTECSSFIASSAFEDPSKRGRGFLARMSGATAEFLSIWILMYVGPNPFFVDSGDHQLRMQLVPNLPLWMFDTRGTDDVLDEDNEFKRSPFLRHSVQEHPNTPTIRFKLFSSIQVYYYNERRADLFGSPPVRYRIGLRDGSIFEIDGPTIGVDLADKIRRVVFVDFVEAFF